MSRTRNPGHTGPEEIFGHGSGHYTVIGDIAILSVPPGFQLTREEITKNIVKHRGGIRTVLLKTTKVSGDSRTAGYEILTGPGTVTTCREYGFLYRLDISTCFFNPKLAYERKRIADQIAPDESVLVLFCGVGPFVIPAAAKGAAVIAVEQNPDACRYLKENSALNGVTSRVRVIRGDAFDTDMLPALQFDRAIVPTPYGRDDILPLVASRVRSGGTIHFYTFKNRAQIHDLEAEFLQAKFEVLLKRKCGNVAPCVSRWVFDLRKQGNDNMPAGFCANRIYGKNTIQTQRVE